MTDARSKRTKQQALAAAIAVVARELEASRRPVEPRLEPEVIALLGDTPTR